jgi:hypothetical protein
MTIDKPALQLTAEAAPDATIVRLEDKLVLLQWMAGLNLAATMAVLLLVPCG